MLFDDLSIDTTIHNGELFANVDQLYEHLYSATHGFADEARIANQRINPPFTDVERAYISGLVQGMFSVVLMLQQGKVEADVDSLNTVEDFLRMLEDNN